MTNSNDFSSEETSTNYDKAFDLFGEGNYQQALIECELAIKVNPSDADAHNLCGAILESLGRWEKARAAYLMAIDLDPDWEEARANLKNLVSEHPNIASEITPNDVRPLIPSSQYEYLASQYEYLVVPFIGQLTQGVFSVENAQNVTEQLQTLLDSHGQDGWDFYRIEKVNIQVSPGCLASLLGARVSVIEFDQVFFRRLLEE